MNRVISSKIFFLVITLLITSHLFGARPTFWTYDCSAAPTWDTQGVYTGGTISFSDGIMDLTCTGATFYPRIQFGTVMNTWYPIDLSLPANSFAKFRIKCNAGVPVKLVCEPRKTGANAGMTQSISIDNTGVWQNVLFTFPFISGTSDYLTGFTFKVTNASGGFVAFSASIDEIVFGTDLSTDYFRSKTSGSWSDINTWESSSDNSVWMNAHLSPATYATSIEIKSGHEISVSTNTNVSSVIVTPGAKLTLSNGNTLTATNGITLQSSTSGTATFVDNNNTSPQAVTGTVEQHLASARNWYLSSPVAGATIPAGQTYYSYDETGSNVGFVAPASLYWVAVPEGTAINPMKGYITQPGAATTKSYTGTFNTDTKTVALTRTNSAAKPGFNLVANPYPSYLDWSMVDTTAANIQTSVWYRTKTSGGAYTFDTYNGKLDVATANGENTVSKLIPPMQAFWVRVKSGYSGGTLTFDNTMRKHADVSGNKMKAPKVSETKIVRLQLSNGINADEALVCFNSNAQNTFDSYDSPKMFESSAPRPELYTLAGNEKVVINGLSDLNGVSSDMELPLGFTTGTSGNFTLRATEIASFDNSRKLYLRDKQQNSETELTPETEYAFNTTTATTNNESRFSLLFKAPGVTTGTTNANSERISVFVNTKNQITIIAKPNSNYSIYNAVGQVIENGILKSGLQTANCKLQTGVLVVKVNNQSTRVIIK